MAPVGTRLTRHLLRSSARARWNALSSRDEEWVKASAPRCSIPAATPRAYCIAYCVH